MANILNDEKKTQEPAPVTYTEADMRAVQAEAAARVLADQNRLLQQQAFSRGQQQAIPQGPDPISVFASEGLAKTPDEQARLLDSGIRGRVRSEVGPALAQMQAEQVAREERIRQEIAVATLFAANPDMASDHEGYYAAYAKAQFRAGQRGVQTDSATLARDAAQIYRADHKQPIPEPPVLEGASRPDASTGALKPPEKPKGESLYEKWYGKSDDDVLHEEEFNPNGQDAIQEYIDERMRQPEEHVYGVSQSIGRSKVRGVRAEEAGRSARRKAAAAGG